MNSFKSFEDMAVWKSGRELVRDVRAICKRTGIKGDFAFVDQITRASRSVPANIAEGFEAMTNKQFIEFLGYAKRSAGEVRSHLYDALDEGYISQEEFTKLAEKTRSIMKMIAQLIRYLQKTQLKQRTHVFSKQSN